MCRSATIADVADPAVGGVFARCAQARVVGHGSVSAPRAQIADSGAVREFATALTSPLEMSCSVSLDRYLMGWRLPEAH
jgi:hypothetical protein